MANDSYILNHYKNIAHNFGDSPLSSIQDLYIRESEVKFFIDQIKIYIKKNGPEIKILDLGCGNGYLLSQIREIFSQVSLFGLEFSPDLLEIASKRKLNNCEFIHGDMREIIPFANEFDIIITERSLINLISWSWQKQAISNIHQRLKVGGQYLMSESFRTSLITLNRARAEMGLSKIEPSKHNLYLQDSFFSEIEKLGLTQFQSEMGENYLSSYFYISRVFHESYRSSGTKIKNSAFVDFFTKAIAPGIGDYSPVRFCCFSKL